MDSGRKTIFKDGFLPDADNMPKAKTHARAKLVYNILRVMCYTHKDKHMCSAALDEIKSKNPELYKAVKNCWRQLTKPDILFFLGDKDYKPDWNDDGTLAIYHPQLDDPVLQLVLKEEKPVDTDKYGQRIPKLLLPQEYGGIL